MSSTVPRGVPAGVWSNALLSRIASSCFTRSGSASMEGTLSSGRVRLNGCWRCCANGKNASYTSRQRLSGAMGCRWAGKASKSPLASTSRSSTSRAIRSVSCSAFRKRVARSVTGVRHAASRLAFTTASGLRSSCPAAAMNSFCRRMANAVGASALPVSRQLMIASSSVPVNQIAPYCTTVWTA